MGDTTRAATRLISVDDAEALTDLVRRNRAFMAPWDPIRPERAFTLEGQRHEIDVLLQMYADGTRLPHVILDEDGAVAGRITMNNIVRGPLMSGALGYWVSEERNGRGLASAAVANIKTIAFGELGLHRIQAETLVHNIASQRVLERNGFERFGLAPKYLHIAGEWQDHVMFQVLNPEPVDVVM